MPLDYDGDPCHDAGPPLSRLELSKTGDRFAALDIEDDGSVDAFRKDGRLYFRKGRDWYAIAVSDASRSELFFNTATGMGTRWLTGAEFEDIFSSIESKTDVQLSEHDIAVSRDVSGEVVALDFPTPRPSSRGVGSVMVDVRLDLRRDPVQLADIEVVARSAFDYLSAPAIDHIDDLAIVNGCRPEGIVLSENPARRRCLETVLEALSIAEAGMDTAEWSACIFG